MTHLVMFDVDGTLVDSVGFDAERRAYFGDAEWDERASAELRYEFVSIGSRATVATSFRDFADSATIREHLGL